MLKKVAAVSFFIVIFLIPKTQAFGEPQISARAEVMDPTSGRYSPDAVSINGGCPVTVKFGGRISTRQAAKVQFRWVQSDGRNSALSTLDLSNRGSQRVEHSWTIRSDYEGWVSIEIMSPVSLKSNRVEFKVDCTSTSPTSKGRTATLSPKSLQPAKVGQKVPQSKTDLQGSPIAGPCRFFVAGDSGGMVDIFDAQGRKIKSFDGNYTSNDGFAVGDVNGDNKDEILIAGDSSGVVDIFDQEGNKLGSFDGDYTINDGFAVGDVNGDNKDEILIAGDSSGRLDIFGWTGRNGNKIKSFNVRYTINDGFGVGDVDGDGREEILVYGETHCFVDIFDFEGGRRRFRTEFNAPDNTSIPYTAISAADVDGDGSCEIVVAFAVGKRQDRGASAYFGKTGIHIYSPEGRKIREFSSYTEYDGFSVADINGDGAAEIVIAGDSTGAIEVFNKNGEQILSFIGNFTKNDGFAVSKHH